MAVVKKYGLGYPKRFCYDTAMSEQQVIATWIAFAITSLRKMTGWSLERFLSEDSKHGIIRFLEENYELLHYYDNAAIVNDVLRFVREKEGAA